MKLTAFGAAAAAAVLVGAVMMVLVRPAGSAPPRFLPPPSRPTTAAPTVATPTPAAPTTRAEPSPAAHTVIAGATRPGRRPPVVDHGPRAGNLVALTFDADLTVAMAAALDSGRVRSYANVRIIEQLERGDVPATFFRTGMWVERYPAVTRRIAGNDRFELANHTYGHEAFVDGCYGLPHIPRRQMASDVDKTFKIVGRYGGRQTRFFRFPGLCHDGAALDALAPLGVTVVDGDVVSGDPFATSWRPIVDTVLSTVRAGSVIILHVTEANAAMTDDALPHILAGLRERGLRPALLSEVLAGR